MHTQDRALSVNPELQRLRTLVDTARARLAELEATLTVDKAKIEAMNARLYVRLRAHFQRRDQVRIVITYRRKYLESLLAGRNDDVAELKRKFRQAHADSEQEYAETAAAMAQKTELTTEETAEVSKLWRKLVKLFHPDRFVHESEKLETYHKLTASINQAKTNGDLATLRAIADDPAGFISRQGWSALDFEEEHESAQLQKLLESIERECIRVLEAASRLKKTPEYELHLVMENNPGLFDQTVSRQAKELERELELLETDADALAKEIAQLSGEPMP